jgi:hypothetical protein
MIPTFGAVFKTLAGGEAYGTKPFLVTRPGPGRILFRG